MHRVLVEPCRVMVVDENELTLEAALRGASRVATTSAIAGGQREIN
jgi:hypothetical protein